MCPDHKLGLGSTHSRRVEQRICRQTDLGTIVPLLRQEAHDLVHRVNSCTLTSIERIRDLSSYPPRRGAPKGVPFNGHMLFMVIALIALHYMQYSRQYTSRKFECVSGLLGTCIICGSVPASHRATNRALSEPKIAVLFPILTADPHSKLQTIFPVVPENFRTKLFFSGLGSPRRKVSLWAGFPKIRERFGPMASRLLSCSRSVSSSDKAARSVNTDFTGRG